MELLAHAIALLATIPNRPEKVRGFYVHKAIGHAMTWLVAQLEMGTSGLHEPIPGYCSTLDPNEDVTQLNPTPLELTQVSLVSLGLAVGLPLEDFRVAVDSLRAAPYPLVRSRLAMSLIEDAYRTGQLAALPTDVALLLDATLASMRQKSTGQSLWLPFEQGGAPADELDRSASEPEFWLIHFCIGLLSLAAHRGPAETTLRAWREGSLTFGSSVETVGERWLGQLSK